MQWRDETLLWVQTEDTAEIEEGNQDDEIAVETKKIKPNKQKKKKKNEKKNWKSKNWQVDGFN